MSEPQVEYRPLRDLAEAPRNPRRHDLERLQRVIARLGFRDPPNVDARTGRLSYGHGRCRALAALRDAGYDPPRYVRVDDDGGWLVPVLVGTASEDDAEAEGFLLAHNFASDRSTWDEAQLADMVDDVPSDLLELSFTPEDVESGRVRLDEPEPPPPPEEDAQGSEEPEPPEPPREPVTRPGDVWRLGDHVLVCGDCREGAVAEVMGEERANIVFTSPPYASQRTYDEVSGFQPIPPEKYVEWWEALQEAARDVLADDGSFFVNIKEHAEGLDRHPYVLDLVLAMVRRWGWHWAEQFCWERRGIFGKPRWRFKNQHESIFQFARSKWKFRPDNVKQKSYQIPANPRKGANLDVHQGHGGMTLGPELREGESYPGNRIRCFNTERAGHSAAFPVKLPEFFVRAYTDEGDVVLDPFAGSGSTLIACERNNRQARCVEISPAYCDVIVERWEQESGGKATRVL